jgi:hypothetical protein
MPLILPGNVASATAAAYDVANSCRFNDGDSASMTKTLGTPTSTKIGTFSCWVKLGNITTEQTMLGAYADSSNRHHLEFQDDHNIEFFGKAGGSTNMDLRPNAYYRDPSAFYNVVVAWDTSQGTDSNRVKLYINGTQVTSWSSETYPAQDTVLQFNTDGSTIAVGRNQGGNYADGYMAEVCFIDGTQYAASDFGEFDSDSPTIWKPKDPSGLTFGTNGFYLDFEASDNLGNDANGGTDLTEANLAAEDQATDTPTNNFATLNPLVNFNSGVFSEGNCAITFGDDTISTIGVTKGRWYWEAQRTNTTTEAHFGIGLSKGFYSATSIVSDGDRLYTRSGVYTPPSTYFSTASNLSILTFGSNNGTSAAVDNGDVIGFYLDLESATKNITIKKNDGETPIVDVDLTYSGAEPIFAFCRMNSGCASSWNFGNPIAALSSANADANGYGSFEFNPTVDGVDYYALCTKNLAEYG